MLSLQCADPKKAVLWFQVWIQTYKPGKLTVWMPAQNQRSEISSTHVPALEKTDLKLREIILLFSTCFVPSKPSVNCMMPSLIGQNISGILRFRKSYPNIQTDSQKTRISDSQADSITISLISDQRLWSYSKKIQGQQLKMLVLVMTSWIRLTKYM